MEEEKSVERDWLYGTEDAQSLSFMKAKKQEDRKDKELDSEIKRRNENDKFIRDLIKEGVGIAAVLVLIAGAVELSKEDLKDEAAMVAGLAGSIGGSFAVLTKNSISKKNESDN